nr:peptide-methionine (R)-S-oxide reductase MsrB [Arenibaculum pallidiluteum]
MTRRVLLGGLAAAGVAATGLRALSGKAAPGGAAGPEARFPFTLSEAEWKARLSPQQYAVLRDHGTERAGTSPLNAEKRPGIFACAGCGHPVFDARTKYESGTGWPSFWEPLPGGIGTSVDRSFFMTRTEVHCANCGGHLGHVFEDGPQPTGLRYCMNGVAMTFRPATA